MKPILIIFLTVLAVISIGIYTLNYLKNESAGISHQLDTLEEKVRSGQWEQAEALYAVLSKSWKQSRVIWSTLIDHFEIDSINIELAELGSYIETGERSDALSKIASLKILVDHIPEKEAFTLSNVF